MNYLLDTNIVLTYIRDTPISRKMEDTLNLLSGENNLVGSVVTIGELKSISKQHNWENRKVERMLNLLQEKFLISDSNIENIIERYAEIDARLAGVKSEFSARNIGKNDLWIAAAASIYDMELITTDNDFNHLDKTFLKLNKINLTTLK